MIAGAHILTSVLKLMKLFLIRLVVDFLGLVIVFCQDSPHFKSFQLTSLIQLRGDLSRKPLKDATEDKSLPVCWKGTKPFKSVNDVKAQFKPLVLSFAKNVQYEIPPEAYLVITVSTYLSFSRPRRVLWRPIV